MSRLKCTRVLRDQLRDDGRRRNKETSSWKEVGVYKVPFILELITV